MRWPNVLMGTSPTTSPFVCVPSTFCTRKWSQFSFGTHPVSTTPTSVANPLGGPLIVWPRASPTMVLGETSAVPVLLKLILDSGLARMAFHRTVRWCQRTYWADWQERLASLSRSCPRVAASMVRQTFSSPGRVDHASHVTWGLPSSTPVASSVSAANWRQHFASVGANSHSFDEDFFEEVSQRFRDINSHQVVPSLFDAPFSPSELRRALNLCFDSAVGADGLRYSVFKTKWWQSAVLLFFNLVLSWGVVPTLWKRSIVVPVFKRGDPSRWFSLGCGLSGWVSCRSSLFTFVLAYLRGLHRHPQSLRYLLGRRYSGSVVRRRCFRSNVEVDVPFPPRFGLAPPSLNPGLTLVLLKDVSYLLSCSTCW